MKKMTERHDNPNFSLELRITKLEVRIEELEKRIDLLIQNQKTIELLLKYVVTPLLVIIGAVLGVRISQ